MADFLMNHGPLLEHHQTSATAYQPGSHSGTGQELSWGEAQCQGPSA
uniref:Uncharacterized protein n=1 Tax=Arundo donax TaxID=35708 RepID=A0A0A9EPF4_ARUDO